METYSIHDLSTMFDVNASTLRYYEDMGLLTNVCRNESKQRVYNNSHIDRLNAINCFKRTGMPISQIKLFFEYEENLPEHIDDIIELVTNHQDNIIDAIKKMEQDLDHIKHKVRFYNAIKKSYDEHTPFPCYDQV